MTSALEESCDLYSIGDAEFDALRECLYREAGVSLSDSKRALVCSRLAKRLRHLQLASYQDYVQYLKRQGSSSSEMQMLVNCLTTNKTDFLRESHHFDFIRDVVIPEARKRAAAGAPRQLRFWSSACSEGDEPYTLAMTVLASLPPGESWDVRILASDINTEVLAVAQAGEYPLSKVSPLPNDWKSKYLLRGSGNRSGLCCIRPEVKKLITFRQVNLMKEWPFQTKFDAIFCRNVIIYFDQMTQERLLTRMGQQLNDSGYLMLGHSEGSPWLSQYFETIGHTIFKCRGRVSLPAASFETEMAVPKQLPKAKPTPKPKPTIKQPSAGQPIVRAKSSIRPANNLPSHNILAGQTCVLNKPGEITTVLGSCVAVCLFDPKTGVGGMNHFMLPSQAVDAGTSARYGIHAMELVITNIMKQGGDRHRLKAKAFGGANLLQLQFRNELSGIGQQNVDFVREFLKTEEIPLVAEKLGGQHALRIFFYPHDGRVVVRTHRSTEEIAKKERDYKTKSVAKARDTGDVVLFQ